MDLEYITIGCAGINPDTNWLFSGIRRYWQETGKWPERFICHPIVLISLQEEMPWLHDWFYLCEHNKTYIIVDEIKCRPNDHDDSISYLSGKGGELKMISDCTQQVVGGLF